MVVGDDALDIEDDIQDGKNHGAEGQKIFIALGKPTLYNPPVRGRRFRMCLAIRYFWAGSARRPYHHRTRESSGTNIKRPTLSLLEKPGQRGRSRKLAEPAWAAEQLRDNDPASL